MTGSELTTFASWGAGAIASLICLPGLESVICASMASWIINYVYSHTLNPYTCYEFKFNYIGQLVGVKSVSGSLC